MHIKNFPADFCVQKYYIDSCIWIDYLEDRKDRFRPLGEWACMLIQKIIKNKDVIVYSNAIEKELKKKYPIEKISCYLEAVPKESFERIAYSEAQVIKAGFISKKFRIPSVDALHALLAKENNAIIVTRDKHFYELEKHLTVKKPEELV